MNRLENHKYRKSFNNSLIAKIFIFQFVNSFNSIIIIAFFKRYIPELGGCVKSLKIEGGEEGVESSLSNSNYCDQEVTNQLIIIALINFLKNFTEVKIKNQTKQKIKLK